MQTALQVAQCVHSVLAALPGDMLKASVIHAVLCCLTVSTSQALVQCTVSVVAAVIQYVQLISNRQANCPHTHSGTGAQLTSQQRQFPLLMVALPTTWPSHHC
jgi:hypothetical protein